MNNKYAIDLRSDTITQPTPAMRAAMADAEVGDDVFGDEPTVKRLEVHVAEMLGKEAALFAPSGTMANQLAIRTHTEPGDEILIDANAHIYYYEAGGPAALSGVSCRCLNGVRGIELDPATVQTNIVFFNVKAVHAKELVQRLDLAGVRMLALGPNSIRAVTNLNVTAEAIPKAVEIVGRVMQT